MTRTGPGDKAAVKAVAVKAVAQDTELVGKAEAEASMEATGEMGKAAKYSLCSYVCSYICSVPSFARTF
jgi:uncharacterized membrane protein YqiK